MQAAMVKQLRDLVLAQLNTVSADVTCAPIRTTAISRVERLLDRAGERSWVLKYVHYLRPDFDEPDVLDHLRNFGVRTPRVHADVRVRATDLDSGAMAMAMEDLGPETRQVELADAAAVAVKIHEAIPIQLLELDAYRLARLPEFALMSLKDLQSQGRWPGHRIRTLLQRLDAIAEDRARDTDIPPYGIMHGAFEPASLIIDQHDQAQVMGPRTTHIGPDLLEFAAARVMGLREAHIGPGLLDLAAWQGTTTPPSPNALTDLIAAYVVEGGTDLAINHRADLPAAQWALGWYRVLTCDRILERADLWEPATHDTAQAETVIRLLDEAVELLRA